MDERLISIVDDDTRLRKLLHTYLQQNGFLVSEAANANEAEDLLKYLKPDAIIMDVMMPQKNGDVLTKELRQKGLTTPILILTARGDIDSRIIGLEAGADDYLPKPFEPKELLLRLNNLLKRQNPPQEIITFGPYSYHTQTNVLKRSDTVIALTTSEQILLDILAKHINQNVTREALADTLHLDNARTVDVQIKRLRQKLDADLNVDFIQTIRGKGYRLVST